jgi:hypothetical protein
MAAVDPERLQKLIGRHQLTYVQLGELLGIDPQDLRTALPAKRLPAAALMHLAELLDESPLHTSEPTRRDPDRARVGALLALQSEGIARDDLASALRWPLDRVERALLAVDDALTPLGMHLIATNGRIQITGKHRHVPARARHYAASTNLTDIRVELVKALYAVYLDMLRPGATNPQLEHALRLGLIERAAASSLKLRLSQPVWFSVCSNRTRSKHLADRTQPAEVGEAPDITSATMPPEVPPGSS